MSADNKKATPIIHKIIQVAWIPDVIGVTIIKRPPFYYLPDKHINRWIKW
jgi:hypothetical protein